LAAVRQAPKPILIHCNGGADRTALISAIYLYEIEGRTAAESSRALNPFYGHIPYLHWRYSIAMDRSYWRYVSNHTAQVELKLSAQQVSP
jgi:undecaprenyl-diphosphatase